ncbi:GntR family transcriptional regulator [Streptomyces sp. SPB4]|uniref:GntR family transcriptional regulator n=1 Tax=Streptomyces sp. SPB4 TaxID=2940553 RepID=UPI0024754FEE|nr:GntR family transcriptional regulator [Streptomyces sp. SPB4]MDH6537804.1 hypothetical protein [Streptomyces sp. SPB4]
MREVTRGGVHWISLADVLQDLKIGAELADNPLLLSMIDEGDRLLTKLDGREQWLVTDEGAFGLAALVPTGRRRRARKRGIRWAPSGERLAPVFLRIYDHYRQAITSGEIPDGAELPNRTAVGEMWEVDRVVVGRAWRLLREEGLIRNGRLGPGRGPGMCCWAVAPPRPVTAP